MAWGDIYDYPGSVPLDLPPARALGAGEWRQAAVVLRDGTVREWGFLEGKSLPPGLDNVVKLSMGYTVNFALVAAPITPGEAIADMRVDLDSLIGDRRRGPQRTEYLSGLGGMGRARQPRPAVLRGDAFVRRAGRCSRRPCLLSGPGPRFRIAGA